MNSRSLREISFVQKLTLNWGHGNVFRRAIALGDVDNDDDNELVIGSLTGNLAIFKGCQKNPWRTCSNLGSISCIVVGDITNTGKNSLVVVSSDGQCNIFMDLEKSNYPYGPYESAPNSTPASPLFSSVVHIPSFMTHVRTRSEADAVPYIRAPIRRVASLEGIMLDPITQAPVIIPSPFQPTAPSQPPPPSQPSASTHPPSQPPPSQPPPSQPPPSQPAPPSVVENAHLEAALSPSSSRTASPSTEVDPPNPNQNSNPPLASLPLSPNPTNTNSANPNATNPNSANPNTLTPNSANPNSNTTTPNPTSPNPNPIPQHAHLPDKSPISTPSSSPTTLRASAAYAASLAHAASAKRSSATTSAQSTPYHSPVSSPGTSPPSTSSQFLSGAGPGNNTGGAPNKEITGYSTGASSASSSAAPSPMTSPRPARRPALLVNTTPTQSASGTGTGSGSGSGTATPTGPGQLNLDEGNLKNSKSAPASEDSKVLLPSFSQKIPSNISAVVITDIDDDGKKELLVGTYDQTIYLFAFSSDEGSFYDAEAPSRPASPVEGAKPERFAEKIEKSDRSEKRCLRLKKKWRLPGQVGSIHVCGSTAVVGLCEGTYVTLDVKTGTMEYGYNGHRPNSLVKGFKPIITNMSGPLKMCPTKGGDCEDAERTLFAAATLDGTIQLAELKRPPYWELKVGTGQLCALRLMDLDDNGLDEIVACWWDGTTLIVDQDRNIATFKFEDRVSAFLCGYYAVHRGQNIACFVYVTLFGEIMVYHNVRIEGVAAQTLMDGDGEAAGWGGWDRRELPSLYQGILYGLNARDAREYVARLRAELAQAENESRELLARVQNKNSVL
eukprot:Phypoly_transcript_02998.p1 GENE.Phypoly_transcript_02998~~Phypoly_transcript_02998.p1  ORF type:complete len:840 (+),score=166.08 Phypoly_transcript_02998:83-2602(+)